MPTTRSRLKSDRRAQLLAAAERQFAERGFLAVRLEDDLGVAPFMVGVAFATQDKQCVDAHFGWAKHLAVYEIDRDGYHFLESFDFGGKLGPTMTSSRPP